MKSMNLFGGNDKSSKALFGDNKSKTNIKPKKKIYTEDFKKKAVKLASKIGVTKAAEELGVSTSSIYSWQKIFGTSTLDKNHSAKTLPSAPIQDEYGNLTFNLEERTYSLNVNSKEEREMVKAEINANSLTKYDWFEEETGAEHWVLYNTEMYEVKDFYLHYREDSGLAPVIPINATSCYSMFYDCTKLTQLDLSSFDTSNVIDMSYMFTQCINLIELDFSKFSTNIVIDMFEMFQGCSSLTQLNLSNFETSRVTDMSYMFCECSNLTQLNLSNFDTSNVVDMRYMFEKCHKLSELDINNFNTSKVTDMQYMFSECLNLTQLDLSSFDTSKVIDMCNMFYNCKFLNTIYISNKWDISKVTFPHDTFENCRSLPNFNPTKVSTTMAKPTEEGGYLTLK